ADIHVERTPVQAVPEFVDGDFGELASARLFQFGNRAYGNREHETARHLRDNAPRCSVVVGRDHDATGLAIRALATSRSSRLAADLRVGIDLRRVEYNIGRFAALERDRLIQPFDDLGANVSLRPRATSFGRLGLRLLLRLLLHSDSL